MVSFSCEACGDILTKKKLDPHRIRCEGATFTCIDCMVHFPNFGYRSHTSCMTEDQKYQGALYKPKKPQQQQQQQQQRPSQPRKQMDTLALQPYVEDISTEKGNGSRHGNEARAANEKSPVEPPPAAPTPPSADYDDDVNVFDFLVAAGQTPSASSLNVKSEQKVSSLTASTSLECQKSPKADASTKPNLTLKTENLSEKTQVATPVSKAERRKSKDGEVKKDKKRKRLHGGAQGDQIMTDAPPVLHSGLTGGLKNMMRLPPSPDYSGDNNGDSAATSPVKKTKHSKHSKRSSSPHSAPGLFGMIAPPAKTKTKTKKDKEKEKPSKKHSHRHKEKKPKLIDFRPDSKDGKEDDSANQMIVFNPQVDVFLSFVNKGPESEKGCSMNKALKRFHRERQSSGSSMPKGQEEKELWRSLRLRKNDRGEIVLFTI